MQRINSLQQPTWKNHIRSLYAFSAQWHAWIFMGALTIVPLASAFFLFDNPTPSNIASQWYKADLETAKSAKILFPEQKADPKVIREYRALVFQVLGGIIAFWAVFATFLRATVADRQVNQHISAIDKEHKFRRKEYLEEKYVRAVQLIGSRAEETSVSGVYLLRDIAHEAPNWIDTIAEVLCAFVRSRSLSLYEKAVAKAGNSKKALETLETTPSVSIQEALRVIGDQVLRASKKRNLSGAVLPGYDLSHLRLAEARMEHINLTGAKLYYTDFSYAWLQFSTLRNAKCRRTVFQHSILIEANITHSKIENVEFQHASLERANFSYSTFAGPDFTQSKREGAKFTRVKNKKSAKGL